MEKQIDDNSKSRINAGRGVVKEPKSNSNKNTTQNQEDDIDRPDERARKAGC